MPPMKLELRAEAEADAVRIRANRTNPSANSAPFQTGTVALTVLRRPGTGDVIRSGAIFFIRTRVVDGSGRLVENLLIPVEVRIVSPTLRRRRDIRAHAQEVLDAHQAAVRSVALAEVARRITALAADYGHGLERARARESRLAETDAHVLVQAGLFDRRHLQNQDRPVRFHPMTASSSLLVAQQSEIVLLLVVTSGA